MKLNIHIYIYIYIYIYLYFKYQSQIGIIFETYETNHETKFSYRRKTQKYYEAKFLIIQISRDEIEK
jgi:hypothetical protein